MSDQVTASHILLMYEGSMRTSNDRSKDDAKTKIDELAGELAGGADFAALAQEHSDCPSSSNGGDLGSFGKGMMVPEFEEAAFSMEVGDTSAVVETPFGYHLIHRTG